DAVDAQYRLQWLTIFEGYAVDVVTAVTFLLMAVMVLCLRALDRGDRAYPWLAAGLVLSAIQRGNQAFFFWWELETIQAYAIVILAMTGSLALGAWTMAWRSWFAVDKPRWLPKMVATLTLVLLVAQVLPRSWLIHWTLPPAVGAVLRGAITWVRLSFLLTLVWI